MTRRDGKDDDLEAILARLADEHVANVAKGYNDPAAALEHIVDVLHRTAEPNERLCGHVGAGDLETLIRHHGEALWPRVEELARDDVRFRRALRYVWAYESSELDRRTALLTELGEWLPSTLRFVAYSHFDGEDFTYRALEVEADIPRPELARILRAIAHDLEHDIPS